MTDRTKVWCFSTSHFLCGAAVSLSVFDWTDNSRILVILGSSLVMMNNALAFNMYLNSAVRYAVATMLAIACLWLIVTIGSPIPLVEPRNPVTNVVLGCYLASLAAMTMHRKQQTHGPVS